MNDRKSEIELDLQKLLQACIHKWWIIAACAIACATAIMLYTINFVTPMYSAGITVYVNNVRSDQDVEYISNNNLLTSQMLVNTYISIIRSDTVLEKIAEKSGVDVTSNQIRGMMRTEQVEETELFNVYITHPDPRTAARLANAVAEVAPREIEGFVEGSSTKILDYAKIPTSPSSPNVRKTTIIGFLIGMLLGIAYVTMRFLMDVRIKDEEDLTSLFELPVLAQIPSFISDKEKPRRVKSKYEYTDNEEKKEVKK